MRAEVIAIGTELLLGQIVDTNSSWIGEQLALAGIDNHLQVKVGDNLERIVAAIEAGLERADAVICCGGLGPTQDDLTRDAIAAVMGVPLRTDPDMEDRILEMFLARRRPMPANNRRQAQLPEGASFIPQQPGTAPGLVCPVQRGGAAKVIYSVPGVPWEMQEMITGTVIPDLVARGGGGAAAIRSRTLRTWGQSESGLAEQLAGRIAELDRLGNPTLAFLASGVEGIKVRITAKADTPEAADAILAEEEAGLRSLLGPLVFGTDGTTMEAAVLAMLEQQGLSLGVAESLTGGLIGARLCDVPGASRVFRGGIVAYDSKVKFDLLGVPEGPVVTEAAAAAMAVGVQRVLGVDVGLSATGVAGPDPVEGRPVGTVCLGVAVGDRVTTADLVMYGRRRQIREHTVITLLDLLRRRLLDG